MKKYKLDEGLESLNRVKLLMSYKNDMTLTENEEKINEQTSENCVISDDEMQEYVNTAVELLDAVINYDLSKLFSSKPAFGFGVGEEQLSELLEIVTKLSKCSFEGKNALISFLDYYKQEEDEDFREEVRGIGLKTLGKVKAPKLKQNIISIIDNTINLPQQTNNPPQQTNNNNFELFKTFVKNDWANDFKGNEVFGIEGDLYYVIDENKDRFNYKLEGNKFIFVQ